MNITEQEVREVLERHKSGLRVTGAFAIEAPSYLFKLSPSIGFMSVTDKLPSSNLTTNLPIQFWLESTKEEIESLGIQYSWWSSKFLPPFREIISLLEDSERINLTDDEEERQDTNALEAQMTQQLYELTGEESDAAAIDVVKMQEEIERLNAELDRFKRWNKEYREEIERQGKRLEMYIGWFESAHEKRETLERKYESLLEETDAF